MTGSKFFFDSAPLIYLVEFNETYYDKISLFFAEAIEQEKELITSVISFTEFGIKPKKLGKKDTILRFESTVTRLLDIQDIDVEIADIASPCEPSIHPFEEWIHCKLPVPLKQKLIFL